MGLKVLQLFFCAITLTRLSMAFRFYIRNSPIFSLNLVNLRASNNYFPVIRPLDLKIYDDRVELISSVTKFEYLTSTVHLYSMVHVGDKCYYDQLNELTKSYDVILYELIISNELINQQDDTKKILQSEVYASKTDQLAQRFQLCTQFHLNMLQPNWYIADLSKEVINSLENERNGITNARFLFSLLGGRAASESLLKSFFLADAPFVTLLRLLTWLLPCPELGALLLDWSRMSPRPGGVPKVLVPIVECLLTGDINGARKLAFAQEILAGLPDAGEWGGAAKSDVEVRVKARNAECCRVLDSFLRGGAAPPRIAVLYGAYHIEDLSKRFVSMGLRPVSTLPSAAALTPNSLDTSKVEDPPSHLVAWSMRRPRSQAGGMLSTPASLVATIGTATPLYLLFGGLDWWLLLHLSAAGVAFWSNGGPGGAANVVPDSPVISPVAVALIYFMTYVQRRLALLQTISQVGLEWQRPLFEEALTDG